MAATRALVEHGLPTGATIRDLGFHRLKGLPSAERIFQVTVDGLPARFAPLNSLEIRRNNLPPHLTSFIGREQPGKFGSVRRGKCAPGLPSTE